MSRKAIVISLLAMFLSGAALGLMGGMLFVHHMHGLPFGPMGRHAAFLHDRPMPGDLGGPGGPGRPGGPGGPGMRGHDPIRDLLPRLTRLLDLTPEQLARLEPKVRATREQFGAVRESLHSRIESELTPEQIQRWREMRERAPFPGEPRDAGRRAHRAPPAPEGEPK